MAKNGNARGSPAGHMVSLCKSAKVKFDCGVSLSQSVLDKTICICLTERLAPFVAVVNERRSGLLQDGSLTLLSN